MTLSLLTRTSLMIGLLAMTTTEGLSAAEAVRSTFRTVGHALWTTTAVLSAGFLAFATSGFEVSWALGLLVTITILFALAADFLLLPPLLIAIDRRDR